ncbi:MAG: porin family protein [Dysgonamonadaceae bacterium]|nr:porin family protein [Dysgonamonadaceae bacterium]MDD4728058.1 porin family protein [Dysgonamonadaceae bacterium]
MKKLTLSLVIAFIGMISLVSAQTASINIKGGLNISNFYGDNLLEKDMQPGFHIGVGADIGFAPKVALQTGLFFSTKGAKYKYDFPVAAVGDVEYNITANYIQMPIHLAYKIELTPETKVVFHAGPYLAYGVGGKRKIVSKFTNDLKDFIGEQEISTFNKDFGLKPFDAGVGVGIGMEFKLITVDLGWDMGLKNIARDIKVGETIYKQNTKNQSAYLSLGYKF